MSRSSVLRMICGSRLLTTPPGWSRNSSTWRNGETGRSAQRRCIGLRAPSFSRFDLPLDAPPPCRRAAPGTEATGSAAGDPAPGNVVAPAPGCRTGRGTYSHPRFSGNMSGHWASPAPCRHVRSWHCLERRLRSRRKSKLRWWRPQIGRKHCRIDGGEKRIPLGRLTAKGHESFRRGDKIALSQRRIIFHAQRSQAKRIFTVTSAVCH
jgi:hypothetical protein